IARRNTHANPAMPAANSTPRNESRSASDGAQAIAAAPSTSGGTSSQVVDGSYRPTSGALAMCTNGSESLSGTTSRRPATTSPNHAASARAASRPELRARVAATHRGGPAGWGRAVRTRGVYFRCRRPARRRPPGAYTAAAVAANESRSGEPRARTARWIWPTAAAGLLVVLGLLVLFRAHKRFDGYVESSAGSQEHVVQEGWGIDLVFVDRVHSNTPYTVVYKHLDYPRTRTFHRRTRR